MSELPLINTAADTPSALAPCPECRENSKAVTVKTMLHHVQDPWNYRFKNQGYYFCASKDCKVVYFSENSERIYLDQMRSSVGQKETDDDRMLCYCYGVKYSSVAEEVRSTGKSKIKEFVKEQTRQHACNCVILNPSGKCCLSGFPD